MTVAYDKYKELLEKVGTKESDYCGQCKRSTMHKMIRETIQESGFLQDGIWEFYQKCTECGHKEFIYRY